MNILLSEDFLLVFSNLGPILSKWIFFVIVTACAWGNCRSVMQCREREYKARFSVSLACPSCCSPAAACYTCPVWEDPCTAVYRSSVLLPLHRCFWMQMVFKDLNRKVAIWVIQSLVLVWFPGSCCCRGQLCRFLLVTCNFESSVVFMNPSLTHHKQKLQYPICSCFAACLISAVTCGGAGAQDSSTWCSGTGFPITSWGE